MTIFRSEFLRLVWTGFCQGIGFELSFFWLWVIWRIAHTRLAHKLESTHWFHKLSEYFQ